MIYYKEGTFHQNKSNSGYITFDDDNTKITIYEKFIHKALHGDRVLVKVKDNRNGFIQKIINRNTETFIGYVEKNNNLIFVKSWSNHHFKDILCINTSESVNTGDVIEYQIIDWKKTEKSPICKIIKKLHSVDNNLQILYKLDLPLKFPDDVLNEINNLQITEEDRELFDSEIYTIDPENSTDMDDAISYKEFEDHYMVYVHVSDVTHIIRPNTYLDTEAYQRGTSIYLGNYVVNMFPEKISSDICSLVKNNIRYAITGFFKIDKLSNKIIDYWFDKTKIIVTDNLVYNKVDMSIPFFRSLYDIGTVNRAELFSNELHLKRSEYIFDYDDNGVANKMIEYNKIESSEMVQSWMMIFNKLISIKYSKDLWIYRTHKDITNDRLIMLKKELKQLDIDFDNNLHNIVNKDIIVDELVLKRLSSAKYSTVCDNHFALGESMYTHATSPIRRYVDIIIHRIVKSRMDGKVINFPDLNKASNHLTSRSRHADMCETIQYNKSVMDIYKTFDYDIDAVVIIVDKKGLYIKTELFTYGYVIITNTTNYKIGQTIKVCIDKFDSTDYSIFYKIV